MVKTCFCTIAFQKNKWGRDRAVERPVGEILPVLADAGYDGVEIWGPHVAGLAPEALAGLRRQLDALGLAVAMVSPYFDFTTSEESAAQSVEEGLKFLDIARRLRSRGVRTFTGKVGSREAAQDQWRRAVQSLQRLADASAPDGIFWAMETHGRNLMDTVGGARRIVEETARPNVRLIFQPPTFGVEYREAFDALEPCTAHIHASNSRSAERTLLGDGDIDYAWLTDRLNRAGFDGYISVEWMGDDPEGTARREAAYLKRITGR